MPGRSEEKAIRPRRVASHSDDEYNSRLDRYQIAVSEDATEETDPSGKGREAGSTDSDSDTSGGTSYETGSEESSESESEVGLDPDVDMAFIEGLDEISIESKPTLVGGWFDSACGWLDRPIVCMGLMNVGRGNVSLLRESKNKTAAAIRTVKMNENLSQTANKAISKEEKRSIRLGRKGLMEAEAIKQEAAEAQEAAEKAKVGQAEGAGVKKIDPPNDEAEENNGADKNPKVETTNEITEGRVIDASKSKDKKELKVVKKKRVATHKIRLHKSKSHESYTSAPSVVSPKRRQPPKPKFPRTDRLSERQIVVGTDVISDQDGNNAL
jgi:hypothetical protein